LAEVALRSRASWGGLLPPVDTREGGTRAGEPRGWGKWWGAGDQDLTRKMALVGAAIG
jgi:hypothetical protein